jgi:tRNA A37 threonylcarbamoyladenosine dehydratase
MTPSTGLPETTATATVTDADYARRFGGVTRLYGAAAQRIFERAHIAVIGLGGVGSWAAEALARNAIGRLTLIDLDNVAESNTNRQIHALDGQYGMPKVTAMAQRIGLINPRCAVVQIDDFVAADNFDRFLGAGFDYVIDAIDGARTKTALLAWCVAQRQPVITSGGAGGRLDPTRLRMGDLAHTTQDPLLAKVRSGLRQQYGFARGAKTTFKIPAVYSDEPLRYPDAASRGSASLAGLNCAGFGSSVCVTASFGFAVAAYVLQRLVGKQSDAQR